MLENDKRQTGEKRVARRRDYSRLKRTCQNRKEKGKMK